MAIKLEDKQNVNAPNAQFPYGDAKDNDGSNNGVPMNRAVLSDYFQFFAKMLDASGITINDLLDSETDGFQYFEALIANIRATTATTSAAGTSERATQSEMNAGDATRHATPEIIIGGTDIITNQAIQDDAVDNDKIADGSIDGPKIVAGEIIKSKMANDSVGWDEFDDDVAWIAIPDTSGDVTSSQAFYRKIKDKVEFKGNVSVNTGNSNISIFQLPVSMRPVDYRRWVFRTGSTANPFVRGLVSSIADPIPGFLSFLLTGGLNDELYLDGISYYVNN